jgi:phosphoenolpyruvate carboxykinase (GTP)
MESVAKNTLFTNVAMTSDGDVWWEGIDGEVPEELTDWKGNPWKKGSTEKAAHPNSRFTAPMTNNPALSAHANDPQGVPISAIIFGGRRSDTVPLVMQAFNWTHGVFLGATMGSETTAAAVGKVGEVRRDPMAMLPFCGYNMGQYFGHWLEMQKDIPNPPKIFQVNWFRKDAQGKFIWPGFGENVRVLKWVIDRAHGRVGAQETLLGWVPRGGHLDLTGLDLPHEKIDAATAINFDEWRNEFALQEEFFKKIGESMPEALIHQRKLLMAMVG